MCFQPSFHLLRLLLCTHTEKYEGHEERYVGYEERYVNSDGEYEDSDGGYEEYEDFDESSCVLKPTQSGVSLIPSQVWWAGGVGAVDDVVRMCVVGVYLCVVGVCL